MISEEDIAKGFSQGLDCSMITFHEIAPKLGISGEEAYRLASCFGVGMFQGSICGAVAAAFLALGYKYGNSGPDQMDQKGLVFAKRDEFLRRFKEQFGEITCPGLMKLDLRIPEEMEEAKKKGLMTTLCPKLCRGSMIILEDML